MTIASHAASLGPNWSDGAVGQGTLSRGHSDGSPNLTCQAQGIDGQAFVEGNCDGLANGNFRQKRTKILAHNQVIWDIGGNLWQWIDFTNLDDKPNPTQRSELRDLLDSKKTAKTDAIPTNAIQSYWQDNWDSDQGLGMLLVGANGLGGNLARGGHRSDDRMAGPFAFNLTMGPQTKLPFVGFRCAYSHPYQVTISSKSQ
jgi:hypothetical protein